MSLTLQDGSFLMTRYFGFRLAQEGGQWLDKDGNVAASIGKKSFSNENLIKNFNSVIDTISKEKPSGLKGNFIQSIYLTSTMGISYKLK